MPLALIITAHDPVTGEEISAYPDRPCVMAPGDYVVFVPDADNLDTVRIEIRCVEFDPHTDVTYGDGRERERPTPDPFPMHRESRA